MKVCDLRRLESVVKKYKEIGRLLDAVYENAYNSGERFNSEATVSQIVRDMCIGAARERRYIEEKIRAFKDNNSL